MSPILEKAPRSNSALSHVERKWTCRSCADGGVIDIVSVPYVFRYLVAELAAMNIWANLETS